MVRKGTHTHMVTHNIGKKMSSRGNYGNPLADGVVALCNKRHVKMVVVNYVGDLP